MKTLKRKIGNLEWRKDGKHASLEGFRYDDFNRLKFQELFNSYVGALSLGYWGYYLIQYAIPYVYNFSF